MKAKILLLLALPLSALTLLSSCKGDEPDEGYTISTDLLKVMDVNLLGNTSDTIFVIEASSAWNLSVVSGDESKLKLSHKSGSGTSSVRITPGPNPSATESRSWELRVTTAAGLSRNVTITQSVADVGIQVSPESIVLNAESETITVIVNSNATWTAVLTGKARNFVHFQNDVSSGSGSGTLDLIFDRNENTEAREGGLQLTATDSQGHQQSVNVPIRQEGRVYNLTVHYKKKTLTNNEQWFDISFHSDLDWEVTVSDSWLAPEQYSGLASQSNLHVKADANPTTSIRSADVVFTIKKDGKTVASDTCHISQAAFGAPEVVILDDDVEETSATLSARCTTDAAKVGVITACGFRYSTDKEAVEMGGGTDVPCQADNSGQDVLIISATITGLDNNTTYYYVAYATNSRGTGQSSIGSFKTGGKDPDENDLNPPPTP